MATVFELAQVVHAQVPGDGVEPGRKACLVLEVGGVLHKPQKDFLGDVLGSTGVAEVAHDEVVDGRLKTAHQLDERFAVPALVAHHEHFVRRVAPRGRHTDHL
jgi:hypothetical protein